MTRRLVLLLLVLLAAPLAARPPLQRGPMVQPVTATTAGIAWITAEAGQGWVEFGATRSLGRKQLVPGKPGRWHYAILSGLEPGSEVFYRVGQGSTALSGVHSFHTAAPPGRAFRCVAVGDCGAGNRAQRTLADRMLADHPELILIPGDVVYDRGSEAEFQRNFFEPYAALLARIPFFPALGNHDARTRDGAPYLQNFHLPHNERWYSFDWGDAHFVALDTTSKFGPGTPQDRWLEADLKAAKARWKVVYFHHPPYSASPAHGSSENVRKAWSPIFERHEVQLVVAGHNHVYERTKPIRGVTYLVTGGGGASLYRTGSAPWLATTASRHHYVRMQVSPDSLSWEAVGLEGDVFDRWALKR